MCSSTLLYEEQIREAASLLKQADAVIIGAGAGLSTAAGLSYSGKRFRDNFGGLYREIRQGSYDRYVQAQDFILSRRMAMHLRSDQYFVEDEHWNEAAGRYAAFLKEHGKEKTLLLELGVGFNTPAIIRFPFEKMVKENGGWSLVRMNLREAIVPESLGKRAVGINDDISRSIEDIRKEAEKDGGR